MLHVVYCLIIDDIYTQIISGTRNWRNTSGSSNIQMLIIWYILCYYWSYLGFKGKKGSDIVSISNFHNSDIHLICTQKPFCSSENLATYPDWISMVTWDDLTIAEHIEPLWSIWQHVHQLLPPHNVGACVHHIHLQSHPMVTTCSNYANKYKDPLCWRQYFNKNYIQRNIVLVQKQHKCTSQYKYII